MTRWELRAAEAALSGFAPGLDARYGTDIDWAGCVRQMARAARPLAAVGLRLAIWVVALAPSWHWRRPCTLSALDPEERARLLQALVAHRFYLVREMALLLKLGAALALLGTPPIRHASGFDRLRDAGERVRRLPLAAGE